MPELGPDQRVDCAIAERCGGCRWIALDPLERNARKRLSVQRAFEEAGLDLDIADCVPSPRPRGYRNRAKFAVACDADGRVRLGIFSRESNRLVDLGACPVQSPPTLAGVAAIREWAESHRLAQPTGALKYVDVREAVDGRLHLTLVLRSEVSELPLEALRRRLPELVGISVNHSPHDSSYPFGERTRTPWGTRSFRARVAGGLELEVPATGFFQVGTELLPLVHRRMREHFEGCGGWLLDLFCGVGTHALSLAAGFEGVLGVERVRPAISCARRNADRLGVVAHFHADRVGPAAIGRLKEAAGAAPISAIVMNPGRSGADRATLDALPAAPLAYLSCEPATLARDLVLLRDAGWRVVSVEPFDFMPQTPQVETLALLARASASSPGTSPGRIRQRA